MASKRVDGSSGSDLVLLCLLVTADGDRKQEHGFKDGIHSYRPRRCHADDVPGHG